MPVHDDHDLTGSALPARRSDDVLVPEALCQGITQRGLQCRRPGNPYCYQHRPPSDALNFEAAGRDDQGPADDQEELFAH